jgi:hypothetical protein
LQVLQDVLACSGRADAALYSIVVEALWQVGGGSLRAHAAELFGCALASAVFGLAATRTCRGDVLEVRSPKWWIGFCSRG